MSPIATARTVTYWHDLLKSNFALKQGLPVFNLPFVDLFSYILQTREFYFLPDAFHSGLQQFVTGIVAPLGLMGVIGAGCWRYRWTLLLLPVVGFSAVLAGYYVNRYDCSYCLQRSLLPVAPVAAVAIGVGLVALWTWGPPSLKAIAVVAGLSTVLVVGHVTTIEARRVIDGAAVTPSALRRLLPAIAKARGGPIYIEGAGQTYRAPIDMPVVYHVVNEVSPEPMAVTVESNDYNGLAFLGGVRHTGREFTPRYRWVVTRVGSVRNGDRTVVARAGPFALERRNGPFDIAITSGILAEEPNFDSRGLAWVQGPMTFWVSAESPRPVWAKLSFAGPAASRAKLEVPQGARLLSRRPGAVTYCAPVATTSALRRLTVNLAFQQAPQGTPKGGQFDETPNTARGAPAFGHVDYNSRLHPMSADVASRIGAVAFWFHSIDVGEGVVTPGHKSAGTLQRELDSLALPPLVDKTVLDIGALGRLLFVRRRGDAPNGWSRSITTSGSSTFFRGNCQPMSSARGCAQRAGIPT